MKVSITKSVLKRVKVKESKRARAHTRANPQSSFSMKVTGLRKKK